MPTPREPIGPKRYVAHKQVYDLKPDEYLKIKQALIDMYTGLPTVDDPVIKAEQVIKQCCEAITPKGKLWKTAKNDVKHRFAQFGLDLDTMAEIPGWRDRKIEAYTKALEVRRQQKNNRGHRPKSLPREMQVKSSIGNPVVSSSLTSSNEKKEFEQYYKMILKEFRELDNPIDRETVKQLAKLKVISDRVMNDAIETGILPKNSNLDTILINGMEKLSKMLGIDRASRNAAISRMGEGTIADLVAEYESFIQNQFSQLNLKWTMEELALLLMKHDRLDQDGVPEINDVVFRRLSGGITVDEARYVLKNPYYENVDDLMKQAREYSLRAKAEKDRVLLLRSEERERGFGLRFGLSKNSHLKVSKPRQRLNIG